jgi:hypothetical protein
MVDAKRYVGIDVAKAQLDVALGPNGKRLRWPTTSAGSARCLSAWNPLTW